MILRWRLREGAHDTVCESPRENRQDLSPNCTRHRNVRSGQGDMPPVRHVFVVCNNHEEKDGVHVPLGQG